MWIANSKAPDAARVFGLTMPELTFLGLLLGAVVSGASDVTTWADLLQPHHLFAVLFSVGAMLVAFANGRAQAPDINAGGQS